MRRDTRTVPEPTRGCPKVRQSVREAASPLTVRGSLRESARICFSRVAFSLLAFALLGPVAAGGQGPQSITVRFLNFESGRPIRNLNVVITLWNESPSASVAGPSIVSKASKRTDSDGRLSVNIPVGAVAQHIDIFAPDLAQATSPSLSTDEVLRSGAVVPYRYSKNAPPQVSAHSGEIVILNKKLTAADRMRRELP
jgi:hypothetical protein